MTDENSVDALLREAANQLRESTDAGWKRAHERILRGLLVTLRPSTPLRAVSSEDPFRVSSSVLVSRLRARLDAQADVQALRVNVETGDDDELTSITVAISIAYPAAVSTTAETVREVTREAVLAALGESAASIDVLVADVHTLTAEPDG